VTDRTPAPPDGSEPAIGNDSRPPAPPVTGRRVAGPIWLNPIAIMFVGTALQLWWMDHSNWTVAYVAAVVVGCTAFAMSAHRAKAPRRGPTDREIQVTTSATRIVGLLMVVGYAVWTAIGLTRGLSIATIVDFVTLKPGVSEQLKREVFASSLFTTFFVNLTVVYFGLAGTMAFKLASRRASRRDRLGRLRDVPYFRVLIVVTILRSVLLSERLVALEMAIGLVVAYFVGNPEAQSDPRKERRRRRLRRRAPAYLLVGSLLFFGLAELPRSFAGKRADNEVSNPVEYSADRIVSYYGSAGDNGAMSLRYVAPVWADGLYLSIPVATAIIGNEADVGDAWFALLDQHEDREFNNPGGWTSVLADVGVPLGLLALALVFFLLGHWWTIAMPRPPVFGIVGAVVVLTALELPRLFYLGQTRAVVALFVAALIQRAVPRRRSLPGGAFVVVGGEVDVDASTSDDRTSRCS